MNVVENVLLSLKMIQNIGSCLKIYRKVRFVLSVTWVGHDRNHMVVESVLTMNTGPPAQDQ